jgi:hypothetical protein
MMPPESGGPSVTNKRQPTDSSVAAVDISGWELFEKEGQGGIHCEEGEWRENGGIGLAVMGRIWACGMWRELFVSINNQSQI